MSKKITVDTFSSFLLYKSPNGKIKVDVFIKDENIWLSQKKIAELFEVKIPAISKHLNNIYSEGELEKNPTISILETVQIEGSRKVKRNVERLKNPSNPFGKDYFDEQLEKPYLRF